MCNCTYPLTTGGAFALEDKYQYNGIELNTDFGLLVNEARFRTLDAQLGRWWQIDPEVEQFEAWSPYNSNLDNPIRYEDKEGDTPGGGDDNIIRYKPPTETGSGGGGFCGSPSIDWTRTLKTGTLIGAINGVLKYFDNRQENPTESRFLSAEKAIPTALISGYFGAAGSNVAQLATAADPLLMIMGIDLTLLGTKSTAVQVADGNTPSIVKTMSDIIVGHGAGKIGEKAMSVVDNAHSNNTGSATHQTTQAIVQATQETLEATGTKMSDEGRKSKSTPKTETKGINNELYKQATGTRYE